MPIVDYYPFLDAISTNNNRPWFAEHKHQYDVLHAAWLEQLGQLIAHMSLWEPRLASLTPAQASYRFYRDTRFSPDKTPYKTYFSAALAPYGKKAPMAGYYLQVDCFPEYNGLHAGWWCPDSAMLRKMRAAIVDNIDEFEQIINDPAFARAFPGWEGETLKTVPKGYDRDHPLAHLLRLKNYGKVHRVDRQFFRDPLWPEKASEIFRLARPMVDFINYSLTEEIPDIKII